MQGKAGVAAIDRLGRRSRRRNRCHAWDCIPLRSWRRDIVGPYHPVYLCHPIHRKQPFPTYWRVFRRVRPPILIDTCCAFGLASVVSLAMHDEWTKKLPDGRIAVYTSEFVPRNGGVITAHVGEIVRTRAVQAPMTREEVEARFKNL